MTQVSKYLVSQDVQKRMYEIFLDALIDVNSRKGADVFINDFFTPTEKIMLPKRLSVALLLAKGYDQRLIAKYLKVSFTTITRISNILHSSGEGYKKVINKIIADEKLEVFFEKIDDKLEQLFGPIGPGSSNWSKWYGISRQKKLSAKKPF